ncbi:gliding motility-associated C-terminal domain-containing protein, partial [Flavobacterium kayseriense]
YTFAVTNTGNTTLTNVIVTDPMTGLTITGNPIATLAVGASNSTIKGTYTITQSDIDAGKVVNTALATAKDPKGNSVTDISGTTVTNDTPTDTPLTQTPRIALVKTAAVGGTGKLGDVITYTFAVTNTGNTTLTNVIVTDPMTGLTITGNPIATLAVGASNSTIKGTYTITQSDIDTGKVVNTALATAKDPKGNSVTDISGTTTTNDTPTETPLAQRPSLEIVKNSTSENYTNVGDILNYTIKVTNTGNVTLFAVLVTDPLTGLSILVPTLEPGKSIDYEQNYSVTQNDISNLSVTNIAYVKATGPGNTEISASDDAVVEAALVLPCGNVVVHNAFSPNGDGINETFIIDSITDTTCYPTNTVEIYNRWGVLVYEVKDYDNVNRAFKGFSEGRVTVNQSVGLPVGTYFYILNYTSVDGNGQLVTNKKDGYLYLTR